ncbi:unnamed protein product [Lepeophtheirus salmonis]|nr:unnamed protein product [Lepeophtheirus salmonis]CAF2987338.1 unnamed protein product [Lepeophtheirus salmonis]
MNVELNCKPFTSYLSSVMDTTTSSHPHSILPPESRLLLKQHSAGNLGSSTTNQRKQPLHLTLAKQWSLAPTESDLEENSNHSLLQIKLIQKNHSLLKNLNQLHSPRYRDIGKKLCKTMNLAKTTEHSLKETTTLLDKTAEMHKESVETLDSILQFASTYRFPD